MSGEANESLSVPKHADLFREGALPLKDLPNEFTLEPVINDTVAMLRTTITDSPKEYGAVVAKNARNELHSINSSIPQDGMVTIDFQTFTEKEMRWIETGQWKIFDKDSQPPDVVFLTQTVAEAHPDITKQLIERGVKVRMDNTPQAVFHTHPSGNLPSLGDIQHVVNDHATDERIIESVVTKSETFFLIPTQETPHVSLTGENDLWILISENEENFLQKFITEKGLSNYSINAARFEFLRHACREYSLGLYVAPKGETKAKRVFY